GDAVLSVDGKPTQEEDVRVVLDWLSAYGNRPAELKVRTAGGERIVKLERRQVPRAQASSRVLPGNIGYVTWESFEGRAQPDLVAKELDKLQGCDGIVVDLRNNGGGDELNAILTTSLFLESGVIAGVDERIPGGSYKTTVFSVSPQEM